LPRLVQLRQHAGSHTTLPWREMDSNCWYRGVEWWISAPPRFRSSFDSPLEEEGFKPSVPEKARLKGSGRLKVRADNDPGERQRCDRGHGPGDDRKQARGDRDRDETSEE